MGSCHLHTAATCHSCGGLMVVAYVIPKLGPHPEVRSFKCPACDAVEAHVTEGAEVVIACQGPERRKARLA